jgi:altronate hydrolase
MTEQTPPRVLVINSLDNVGVALEDLSCGQLIRHEDASIRLGQDIRFGHKFALRDLSEGEYIIKYGARVGIATCPIAAGEHVHVHNVRDIVDEVRRAGRTPSGGHRV